MDYSKSSLVELKAIAKERGMKVSGLKKQEIIDRLVQDDNGSSQEAGTEKKAVVRASSKPVTENTESEKKEARSGSKMEKKAEAGTERKADVRPEHKPDTRQEHRSDAVQQHKQDAASEHKTDAVQQHKPDTASGHKTDAAPEHKSDARPEHKAGAGSEQKRNVTYSNAAQGNNDRNNNSHRNQGQLRRTDMVRKTVQHAEGDARPHEDKRSSGAPTDMEQLDSGEVKSGILEVMGDGYGFIRCDNYLPGEQDVYVSPALIRRFGLRTGDIVEGNTRIKSQNEKFSALLYLKNVNGYNPAVLARRSRFEDLTPIFPNERIHLETAGSATSMRMVDLISPIGKGQRGMIVSQPKTGKTTLLKQVAKAVKKNHPEMHLIILLIDERPEEVTDIKESIEGEHVEVIYSTFDELPDNHKRVSEMVIERAKRLVEHGKDVMILLDSITRLARAYNLTIQPSGRTLSGGLDPAALYMPKRFFGAARNMREGGSLTILATALVDTGSRMDDVVFEEFKGTGNMELVLDRSLSEKRIFPAIDLPKSSTRREDLLLSKSELEASFLMRRALNSMKSDEAVEQIINMFMRTKNNNEFIEMIKKVKIV